MLCNNNEVGFYESCGWLKYTEVGVRVNANAPVLQLKNGINCLLFIRNCQANCNNRLGILADWERGKG